MLCIRAHRFTLTFVVAAALVACSSQKEPAQAGLAEIEGTVSAASAEAAKFVPERLRTVQDELDGLRASYARADYAAVVSRAPAVLSDSQALAAAAAAAKADVLQALNDQWNRSSVSLPAEFTVLSIRIDDLGRRASKRRVAEIDLDAARAALSDASSLWSKAQAAFASDNLREAVSTAASVDHKLQSIAAILEVSPR